MISDESRLNRTIRLGLASTLAISVLAMYPYTVEPTVDIKRLVLAFAAAVLCVFAAIGLLWTKGSGPRIGASFFPLILLNALFFCSAYSAPNPARAVSFALWFSVLLGLYWLSSRVMNSATRIVTTLQFVGVSMLISAAYATFQHFGYDPFPWDESVKTLSEYKDFPGALGNPNYAGHALVLIIPALFAAAMTTRRVSWTVVALLLVAHLFGTQHRAGLLAVVVGGLLVLMTMLVKKRSQPVSTAFRAALAIGLAGMVIGLAFSAGVYVKTGSVLPLDPSLLLRYNSYLGAARMIADHPLLGIGAGNYVVANPPYWTTFEKRHYAEEHRLNENVHCDPLEFAVEGGLVAALLLIGIVVYAVQRGLVIATKSRTPSATLVAGLTASIAASSIDMLFGFPLHTPVASAFFFVVLGMLDGMTLSSQTVRPRQKTLGIVVAFVVCLGALVELRAFLSQCHLQHARVSLANGQVSEAESESLYAILRAPWSWRAREAYAKILARKQSLEDARAAYRATLEEHPAYISAQIGFANAAWSEIGLTDAPEEQSKLLDLVEQGAQSAIQLCPALPEAHSLLARASLLRADSQDDSARDAQLAASAEHVVTALGVAKEPGMEVSLLLLLHQVRDRQGDVLQATRVLEAALRRHPADGTVWQVGYTYFARLGEQDRLERIAKNLLEFSDNATPEKRAGASMAALWYATSIADAGAGFSEVQRLLELALRANPENNAAWREVFTRAIDTDHAVWVNNLIAEIGKGAPPIAPEILVLGRCIANPESLAAAIADIARLSQEQIAQRGSSRGNVELKWVAEILDAQLAKSKVQTNAVAHSQLATLYALIGDVGPARTQYERALELETTDEARAATLHELTRMLLTYHQSRDAEQVLRGKLSLVRKHANLQWSLAQAIAAQGKISLAKEEYNRLLAEFSFDEAQRAAIEAEAANLDKTASTP